MSLHRNNCNAIGCETYVLKRYPMCLECWNKVPESLRVKICIAQRRVKRNDHEAKEQHRELMREAIKIVRDTEQELTP